MAGNGNSSPEILEMLELILSTVSMLRVIMGDELRSTTPFWSLLIRSLAHVCYDKSYIIEDVPFDIRPSEHMDVYSEGPYDENDQSSIFDSDNIIGSSSESEIPTNLTSIPSCHVPWMLISTLYQRYTWGIDAPVIGIVLSKMSTVAYSDKESSDSSLGIYDLTDPSSALQFAQFILGLQTHVKRIVEQCSRLTFRLFSWRHDSIDKQCGTEGTWERQIYSWLSDIPQPHESRNILTPVPFSSPLCLSPNHAMSRSRSATPSSHQHSSYSARSTSLTRSEGKPFPAQCGRTTDRSGRLGRKAVEGIAPTDKLSWGSYSHDRKVISLAAINLGPNRSNDTVAVDEINRMKAVYDQLTGYQAPPWESIEDMPSVDKRMNIIRDHFFKQMKDCPRDMTLCTEHTNTIADSFSSLCWVSVGGFSKMVAQWETNEAEARHDWDFLMYLMYLSQSAINPSRPLLERTISLSQNIVVDSFSEPEFAKSFMTCAQESIDLNELACRICEKRVHAQAIEAYAASIKHAKAVDSLFESQTVEIDIRSRADIEPKTAVCDIILPFPLDAPQIESEPLIKLAKPKSEDWRCGKWGVHAIPEKNDADRSQSGNLQNPFSVNCSETKDAKPLPPDTVNTVQSLVGLLLLAVLVGEYKKYSDRGFLKALIQTRIYIEASCRHLASLGITDHPVFGLATNGCEGAVLMGWYSQAKDVIYLMERNVRTFNISSPIQVYHFATFILRLRDHSQTVLKKKALEALGNAATFEQKSWTKQAQNDRLGLDAT
ncbi:hypothetical protein IW262DRAFT_1302361 [Armillaria fumosa]|nr:hypothetical protein IW262DRAFT_1302361 [Armillaria fumosa]